MSTLNQFSPKKEEKTVRMEITAKEAHLLKILRGISFGKVIVQKAEGRLVRVEPSESILLTEEAGIAMVTDSLLGNDETVVAKK